MNKDTLQNIIIDCIDLENFDEALDYLDEYALRFEEDLFYYLSFSDILLLMEDYEGVIDIMTEATEERGFVNSLIFERMGDAYYGLKEYDQAIAFFKKCDMEEDTDDQLYILYKVALSFKGKHMYTEAISYFEDVLLDMPYHIDVLLESALCYVKVNQIQRAMEYLDKVLTLEPDQIYPICDELLFQDNEEILKKYVNKLDTKQNQYNLLLTFYIYHENKTKAYDCIHKLLKREKSLINLDCLASTYDHFGDHKLACQVWKYVVNKPDDPNIPLELSMLIHFDGFDSLKSTSKEYRTYIHSHMADAGNDLHIFNTIVQFLSKHEDWKLMAECIKMKQPSLDCEDPEAIDSYYSILLHYYLETEKFKEGLSFLENKVPTSYSRYQKTKVMLNFYMGNHKEVISEYEDAMPDGIVAYMAFISYQRLGKENEANDLMEDFLCFSMNHPDIEDIDLFIEFMDAYMESIEQ